MSPILVELNFAASSVAPPPSPTTIRRAASSELRVCLAISAGIRVEVWTEEVRKVMCRCG